MTYGSLSVGPLLALTLIRGQMKRLLRRSSPHKTTCLLFHLVASLTFTAAFANCALTQTQSRPNVGALLQRLPSADDTERGVIMDELDKIKAPDEIVPVVLTALDQVDPREAWKVLDVLARFPGAADPATLVRLARRISPAFPETLRPQLVALGDPARKELLNAIDIVCRTWQPPSENSEPLQDDGSLGLQQESQRIERFLGWAGSALAATGSAGLDDLGRLLQSHNTCHPRAAQDGLADAASGGDKETQTRVLRVIRKALSDADTGVQQAAVLTLNMMIGSNQFSLSADMQPALFDILKTNPHSDARFAAFSILRTGSSDTRRRAANIALHDSDEAIRDRAESLLNPQP